MQWAILWPSSLLHSDKLQTTMAPSDTTTCRSPLIFTWKRQGKMYVRIWATIWVSLCIEKGQFFRDSPLNCLTYFLVLLGLDGDLNGEVRVLGKDDREMLGSNSGKKGRKHERAAAFQHHRPPRSTMQGETSGRASAAPWKHLIDFTKTTEWLPRALGRLAGDTFQMCLTQRMISEGDVLFVLSLARELIHILPGEWKQTRSWLSVPRPPQEGGGAPGCAWCHHLSPLRLRAPRHPWHPVLAVGGLHSTMRLWPAG